MTTIPVERELLASIAESLEAEINERYGPGKHHPALKRKYDLDMAEVVELRQLLSEQPQADHSAQDLNMVEQPQAGAVQANEVRRLREALEAIQSRASNLMDDELFDMCDAALTHSPKGEEE